MKKLFISIDMTVGSPIRSIVLFASPLIIANLFQMFYTTVDTVIVGKEVGTLALAAVGASTPIIDLLIGLTIGLANGLSIAIAQHVGSRNKATIKRSIANGAYLILVLAIFVMVIGLIFQDTFFRLTNFSDPLFNGARQYTTILLAGTLFSALYNYEAAILRAQGNSMIPLFFLILSVLSNIVLDLFFVRVIPLGIAGVALATIVSQFFCAIGCFFYLKNTTDLFSMTWEDRKFDKKMLCDQIRIALPMAFFQSLLAISFVVVQSALNQLGNQEVAAYTAAYKMDSFVMQLLAGFGTAISTFAAQNLGNQTFERIRQGTKDTLKITLTISIFMMILARFCSEQFMLLFVNGNEKEIISLGMQYLSFTSLFYWILGINFVVRFVLTGLGRSIIPLGVGILEIIIRCLGTYFFVLPYGFSGMIMINPLCWFTSTSLILLLFPKLFRSAKRKLAL